MKYIKTHESFFDLKYGIGDYVKLDDDILFYPYAKIIELNRVSGYYKCIMFFSNKIDSDWIDSRNIERVLTPQEIQEFEIKLNQNKYNL